MPLAFNYPPSALSILAAVAAVAAQVVLVSFGHRRQKKRTAKNIRQCEANDRLGGEHMEGRLDEDEAFAKEKRCRRGAMSGEGDNTDRLYHGVSFNMRQIVAATTPCMQCATEKRWKVSHYQHFITLSVWRLSKASSGELADQKFLFALHQLFFLALSGVFSPEGLCLHPQTGPLTLQHQHPSFRGELG